MSTTELQQKAIKAVQAAMDDTQQGLPGGALVRGCKHLRDTTGLGLREIKPAVEWAIEHFRTLDVQRFLVSSQPAPSPWWRYRFPNGYTASVIPDLHQPFRFEVARYSVDDVEEEVTSGLSTAEVEAKLAAIYNLPAAEKE